MTSVSSAESPLDVGSPPDPEAPTRTVEPAAAERRRASKLPQPGSKILHYTIVASVGRGGMGEVYEAHDPRLDRNIALKVHRTRRGRSKDRDRLLREARALASLTHPNVIEIYDVGSIDGDVFLAMELVRGRDLRRWMRAHGRAPEQILQVFTAAGRGLEAAHDRGLIHRDFKPDNILLGDDGRVRVIDFGLARGTGGSGHSLDGSLHATHGDIPTTESSDDILYGRLTRTNQVLGTPGYMAPELHLGRDVDARADQFAFCVSLYEALYGTRPFRARSLEALRAKVLRGEPDPTPPSVKVDPRLRAVLLRGLSANPNARYASMSELLAALGDLDRPRRRRWAYGTAGLLLVGTGFLAAVSYDDREPCERGSDRLAGVWDAERRDLVMTSFGDRTESYARSVGRRVSDILDGYAEHWVAMYAQTCHDLRDRRLEGADFDLSMQCLERRRSELESLARDLVMELDSTTLDNAVQAAHQLGSIERCADTEILAQRFPLPDDPRLRADVESGLRELARVQTQANLGHWRQAIRRARSLEARARAMDYQPLFVATRYLVGALLKVLGDYEEAERAMREVAEKATILGDDHTAAEAWIQLLWAFYLQGKSAGVEHVEEAARVSVIRAGSPPDLVAGLTGSSGMLHMAAGRYDEAVEDFARTVELYVQARGEQAYEVARARVNLASALRLTGQTEEALRQVDLALAIGNAILGPQHPDVALAHYVKGYVHSGREELEAALESYHRALVIRELVLGADHPSVASTLHGIGSVSARLGRLEDAASQLQDALARTEDRLGSDHPNLAYVLDDLAQTEVLRGKLGRAVSLYRRSLDIRERRLGSDHPLVASTLAGLALALLELEQPRLALTFAAQGIEFENFEELGTDQQANLLLAGVRAARATGDPRAQAWAPRGRAVFEALGDLDGWQP